MCTHAAHVLAVDVEDARAIRPVRGRCVSASARPSAAKPFPRPHASGPSTAWMKMPSGRCSFSHTWSAAGRPLRHTSGRSSRSPTRASTDDAMNMSSVQWRGNATISSGDCGSMKSAPFAASAAAAALLLQRAGVGKRQMSREAGEQIRFGDRGLVSGDERLHLAPRGFSRHCGIAGQRGRRSAPRPRQRRNVAHDRRRRICGGHQARDLERRPRLTFGDGAVHRRLARRRPAFQQGAAPRRRPRAADHSPAGPRRARGRTVRRLQGTRQRVWRGDHAARLPPRHSRATRAGRRGRLQ